MAQETNNKVSIVVYVHDGDKTLKRCIDGCLAQSYADTELIVVNDASPKRVLTVLKEYRENPKVKIIDLPKVSGLGRALNIAFAKASGGYLTWIKDTVSFDPTAVEKMLGFIRTSSNVHFVYADCRRVLESGEQKDQLLADHLDLSTDNAMSPCFLYSVKVKEATGPYVNAYDMASDYDYWIRVAKQFNMVRCPQILATAVEVPYYGQRIDRIYMHLFKRLIRYNNGFLPLERLTDAVEDFDDRIKKHAKNIIERTLLLLQSDIKLYKVSLRTGLLYEFLWLCVIFRTKFEPAFKVMRVWLRQVALFAAGSGLKKNSKGKNILCLVPNVVVGGSEKVTKDIVEQTRPYGYSFHLLAVKGENNDWCRAFLKIFDNVILLRKNFNTYDPLNDEEYYAYLKFMIEKLDVKIVLISNPLTPYRCLERLKTDFPKIKVVDLLHVVKFAGTSDETLFAVPFIDKRVCISSGLKDHMREKYQKAAIDLSYMERMTVIHNGNDMQRYKKDPKISGKFRAKYNISSDTKIISYIGRLSSEKRPIIFVDIAESVLKSLPGEKIKFVMAGDGVYRKGVEARIRHLGLEKDVILTGMVTSDQVRELMADSHQVLITSSIEGLPLVAVEAMSMNVPVISTDVGSIKEAITHGVSGFLVHPQEKVIEGFSDVIKKLCSSPELYDQIASKTRDAVHKEFSFETFAKRYADVFEEMISK